MRKSLFTFIGLMFTISGFAQSYHPIPTDSVFWVETNTGPYLGGSCIQTLNTFIYPVTDLVIAGKTYTEFHARTVIQYSYFGPPPSTCPTSSGFYPDHIYAFLRNDSINKKVYAYDSSTTHADILLYDFDIALGDTLNLLNAYGYNCSSDTFTVTNIDSVNIGGEYRNRYEITSAPPSWYPIYLIEGIGSNYGLAFNEYCPFEYTSSLTCYHYKQFEYGNVSSPFCTATLSIDNEEKDPLLFIHPLGSGLFEVMNNQNNHIRVSCYDMMGKFVLERSFSETGYLNLSEVSSGVYVMYISIDNQSLKPYKFVISH